MPSVRSTQHPSPAVSRANSPPAQENTGGSIAMPPPPADPPMSNSLTPTHKPTLQEIQDAGYHNFVLKIIAVKSTRANYNPAEAVQHLNAVLQDTLASKSGIPDIPRELYRVVYEEPPPGTFGTNGQFLCRIPKPLESYITDLTAPKNEHGPLAFTGDDWDNAYKLELTTFTQKQFSAEMSREKNEKYWLHIILDRGNTLSKRTLYELTAQHLSKFGMTIQGHERAFFEMPDGNKEQGSGKWHCEYILDEDKIPRGAGNYWDITQLKWMETDPETHERAKIWVKPENITSIFGACGTCWKHIQLCEGHEVKKFLGQKRESKQVANESAQRRMAKKAEKKFAF